jgi:hypothetical protein
MHYIVYMKVFGKMLRSLIYGDLWVFYLYNNKIMPALIFLVYGML